MSNSTRFEDKIRSRVRVSERSPVYWRTWFRTC